MRPASGTTQLQRATNPNKPKEVKLLIFRRISNLEGKQTQRDYVAYYEADTAEIGANFAEYECMAAASDQRPSYTARRLRRAAKRNKPNEVKSLIFRRISNLEGKQTQRDYVAYYEADTAEIGANFAEYECMTAAPDPQTSLSQL